MARIMIVMTADEIRDTIPYAMICQTMLGSAWETSRRRRLWKEAFTEREREACLKLRNQARQWYLAKGVPDEVTMAMTTLDLWNRLGEFCASI